MRPTARPLRCQGAVSQRDAVMPVTAVVLLVCAGLVGGCADQPRPASPVAAIARACQHPVSSQVQLAGAVLTTSKCAD
jgi:hypothetical protein